MTSSRRIFRPWVPEGFEWALPTDTASYEVFLTLSQRPVGAGWDPVGMELLTVNDRGRRQKHAYLPWLGSHMLILRDEAVEAVGEILRPHGEVLPLVCDEARLALFSAPLVTGVLDEERSEIIRFSSGEIMDLRPPVFRMEVLGEVKAFKLAEIPRGDLYLTDDIVEAILATGLTSGTLFQAVYEESS